MLKANFVFLDHWAVKGAMLAAFIPALVWLSAVCIHISSCVDTSLLYWPDASHKITCQLSDKLWAVRRGAKARAGAVSKLFMREWQFVISDDLILVRAKSNISAIVNSISVIKGSGKRWIVFIWHGWRFLFYSFVQNAIDDPTSIPIWLFILVSPGELAGRMCLLCHGAGGKQRRERLTWEWFICAKIDHAKSKTQRRWWKCVGEADFSPSMCPLRRKSVPFQALPVKHPQKRSTSFSAQISQVTFENDLLRLSKLFNPFWTEYADVSILVPPTSR